MDGTEHFPLSIRSVSGGPPTFTVLGTSDYVGVQEWLSPGASTEVAANLFQSSNQKPYSDPLQSCSVLDSP